VGGDPVEKPNRWLHESTYTALYAEIALVADPVQLLSRFPLASVVITFPRLSGELATAGRASGAVTGAAPLEVLLSPAIQERKLASLAGLNVPGGCVCHAASALESAEAPAGKLAVVVAATA
jgi:hypothetical protein